MEKFLFVDDMLYAPFGILSNVTSRHLQLLLYQPRAIIVESKLRKSRKIGANQSFSKTAVISTFSKNSFTPIYICRYMFMYFLDHLLDIPNTKQHSYIAQYIF